MAAPPIDPAINGYSLAIGGKFIVQFWEFGSEIVARTWVQAVREGEQTGTEILERLMRFQLRRLGHDDLVLSLDPDDGDLYLHRRFSAETLDSLGLHRLMQEMVDGAARYRAVGSPEQPAPATLPPHMIIRP
ncbi:MAG: CesT family type III secretion system chaperone [Pseudomonadota bacterium]